MPGSIKLVQFFYDMEAFPAETAEDGWLVKTYEQLNTNNAVEIATPAGITPGKYCGISFEDCGSLPDLEGLELYSPDTWRFVTMQENTWDLYEDAVAGLTGAQHYRSQWGGYPAWVQGESTPKIQGGENMPLLFQIDSEDHAGLMWGDMGLVYVFYDAADKQFEFVLQSH